MPDPETPAIKRLKGAGKAMEDTYGGFRPSAMKRSVMHRKEQVTGAASDVKGSVSGMAKSVAGKFKAAPANAKRDFPAASKGVESIAKKLKGLF